MEKVFRRDVPFAGPFADSLEIEAAGNEYEGAQVVVVPIDGDLEEVRWAVKPFDGDPRIRITCSPVGYVKSANPQLTAHGEPSPWWPDPLLEFLDTFDCPRGEVQPLWINVYVPPGTQTREYTTRLTVTARNAEAKSLPIRLTVFGFDIPREQHLKTVWGTGEKVFAQFYPDYDEALAWKYFDLMLSHRMAPNDLYRKDRRASRARTPSIISPAFKPSERLREAGSAWWNIGYVLAPGSRAGRRSAGLRVLRRIPRRLRCHVQTRAGARPCSGMARGRLRHLFPG